MSRCASIRLAAACTLAAAAVSVAADEPAPFDVQLAALAAKCDELGLKDQAQTTRQWNIPRHPGRQYLFVPAASDPAAPPADAPMLVKNWHERFRGLRTQRAEALLAAARQASDERQPGRAWQLLHEVLREDPQHAEARRILGIAKPAAMTPQKPRAAQPKLGWPAGTYWRIETPHFDIVTDHSPREGQELGRELESLDTLWRQIFFRYWSSGEALAARFAGRDEPLARPRPKMNVALVKDRAEYVARLKANLPQVERTVGIYLNKDRTSFFYGGDTSVYPTWRHEATHQLFQEAAAETVDSPGEEHNFWAIEGAALYMESLVRHDGYWTAGGCEADRLQFARYRGLAGDVLPLTRLAAMSRTDIQDSPEISKLYSQAAGAAHYLIDGQGGKHGDALVDLLAAIYRGDDTAQTLAQATGATLPQLDQEYRGFLNVTDDDLAGIPNLQRLKNVSLGRTGVTDKGLATLAACKELQWLDLTLIPATDGGFKSVAGATKLRQLFLEGTKITDASLPQIGSLKQLEELDLANLAISDEGLAALAGLKNLTTLYLTGTPVGDAGLAHLKGLKQLQLLETTGTKVTPEGRKKLEAALPKLKSSIVALPLW